MFLNLFTSTYFILIFYLRKMIQMRGKNQLKKGMGSRKSAKGVLAQKMKETQWEKNLRERELKNGRWENYWIEQLWKVWIWTINMGWNSPLCLCRKPSILRIFGNFFDRRQLAYDLSSAMKFLTKNFNGAKERTGSPCFLYFLKRYLTIR